MVLIFSVLEKWISEMVINKLVAIIALYFFLSGVVFSQQQPGDIIIAVDNSGSMGEEAGFVQASINQFTAKLHLAGIDSRLVLISAGSSDSEGICVPLPTGSGSCPDDTSPPAFLHILDSVGSSDALDKIIDNFALWGGQMRPEARKHVIVVSDDDSSLSAGDFNTAFLALDPSHAGYTFHTIASPEDPIPACVAQTVCCPDFVPLVAALGQQYIDLTALTGGVFNNICFQDFEPFFNDVALSVILSTPVVFDDGFESASESTSANKK